MTSIRTTFAIGLTLVATLGAAFTAPASAATGSQASQAAATFSFVGDADGVSPGQAISNAKADAQQQADAAGATQCQLVSQHVFRDSGIPSLWEAVVVISCRL
jgi:hypothetical protein